MQIFELQAGDYDDSHINGISNGSVDVAFRKINKNSTGFLIWRIENMNVVSIPKDQYGTFYDNDSYIVFASTVYGTPAGVDTVTREVRGASLEYHVHFWLGSLTTPNKSGVAAYKTVELDGYIGGCTTQHRETQGNESARFKSYFKNGIKVLSSESVTKVPPLPKLFKVKGKRSPILVEMNDISWDKFSSGEILLLQTQKYIFVWIGRASNAAEKLNASKMSMEIKEQNNIPNVVFMDDGYEKTLQDDEKKEFNKYLPLDKRHILSENESDLEVTNIRNTNIRLYKCSENNGKYRVAELKSGPLTQSDLDPDDVFIIDQETNGIWVWVGKRVNDKERGEALRNARGFVKKKKYPNNTKVTRVVDGFEPNEFKVLFPLWKDEVKSGRGAKPSVLISKFDALAMQERPSLAADTQLIDDGSGSITLWRIKQHNIIEVAKERHGFFFSGDCYIILYTYQLSVGDQNHLLYYWLGSHATQEEIACATSKASEINKELLNGLGFQARIIQGREPPHFLQIFRGKLIVFKGKGSDFDESGRNLKHPLQYFLQIFGSSLATSRGIQVQPRTSVLNSNYCFVLKRGKHAHIWCGNYSTGDQREMAKLFAGKDFELVLEGKEKSEFFDMLGGKSAYANQLVRIDSDSRPARLFHCYKVGNSLKAEEIIFFNQSDLLPEDVMLIDFHNVLYLWVGSLSSKDDQRQSLQLALEYLQSDPSGRDLNIPIIQIYQGCEPPTFTGFFPAWDPQFWKLYRPFGKVRQEIERTNKDNTGKEMNGNNCQKSGHSDFDQYDKYPIDILKEPNEKLPAKVDPLNKELHLTHDDFVSILKMTYEEFDKLPRWKKQEMKKKVGLF